MSQQIGNGQILNINQPIVAPIGQPGVDITGNNAALRVGGNGSIAAPDEGNSGVLSVGNNVAIDNSGSISGAVEGVGSDGNNFTLRNRSGATIASDSRAVALIGGDNITVVNEGNFVGTGDQRNGTIWFDGTVDNANFLNAHSGLIDAGVGNSGDGVSVQVGDEGDLIAESINISNRGTIAGRGQAEFSPEEGRLTANGSSGVRYFNLLEDRDVTVRGNFQNTGTISAEVNVGFLGGFVVEDSVSYQGQIRNSGSINGPRNGLYIGNADHELAIFNEGHGRITSGSRAVNLDGDDVSFNNSGSVIGTGDQRDGTLYVDGTGDNIDINNAGVIDAGVGNSGSGVSVQVGTAAGLDDGSDDLETSADIVNNGLIQGRGTENVPAGVRLFVGSDLETSTFTGDIVNGTHGVIASEHAAGILIESGVTFNGQINNQGTIRGGNGLAVNAAGASGDINLVNSGSLEGAVVLGQGNDTLLNHSADALDITGGGGNDVLTGGAGANTYRFAAGSGQDTITDFQVGHDVLDLGAYFTDPHSALGATTQVGHDVLIDLGNDNSITLANVDASSFGSENIIFG